MYLDDMPRRNKNHSRIAGRGAAMAVASPHDISHNICDNCRQKGHLKSDCAALANNKGRGNSSAGRQRKDRVAPRGRAGHKWRSFHNPSIQNEADGRAQGTPRQQASGSYTTTAVRSATPPPDDIEEDWDLDCEFVWMTSLGGQTAPSQATNRPLAWLTSMWSRFTQRTKWATSESPYRLGEALLSEAAQLLDVVRRNYLSSQRKFTRTCGTGG